jgi:hypothetical protein
VVVVASGINIITIGVVAAEAAFATTKPHRRRQERQAAAVVATIAKAAAVAVTLAAAVATTTIISITIAWQHSQIGRKNKLLVFQIVVASYGGWLLLLKRTKGPKVLKIRL